MSRHGAHSLAVLSAGCALAVAVSARWRGAIVAAPGPATTTPVASDAVGAAVAPALGSHWAETDLDATRTPVEPGAATAAQPDPEWSSYPRSTGDLVRQLVQQPEQASATALLRSRTFNPRDIWLCMQERGRVARIVEASAAACADSARTLAAAREQEFALARARGAAIAVDLTSSGDLALREAGPDPFFQQTADGLWAAPRAAMPRTCALLQRHRALGKELVAQLGQLFFEAGALLPTELGALQKRATRFTEAP